MLAERRCLLVLDNVWDQAHVSAFAVAGPPCRVLVTKGMENTNKLTMREYLKFKVPLTPDPVPPLAYVGHEDTMRLACCTTVRAAVRRPRLSSENRLSVAAPVDGPR